MVDWYEDIPHARTTDPRTSKQSGAAIEAEEGTTTRIKPGTAKHIALRMLFEQPRTGVEVERDSKKRGIWKRVSDLKNAGLVQTYGTRRDALTDREGIVWGPSDLGMTILALLEKGEQVSLRTAPQSRRPLPPVGDPSAAGRGAARRETSTSRDYQIQLVPPPRELF